MKFLRYFQFLLSAQQYDVPYNEEEIYKDEVDVLTIRRLEQSIVFRIGFTL